MRTDGQAGGVESFPGTALRMLSLAGIIPVAHSNADHALDDAPTSASALRNMHLGAIGDGARIVIEIRPDAEEIKEVRIDGGRWLYVAFPIDDSGNMSGSLSL